MQIDELLKDWIKIDRENERTRVFVRVVRWNGHTPFTDWKLWQTLDEGAAPDEQAIARAVHADKRFFATCTMCGAHVALGHMIDTTTCHGCAEQHLGVIF